MPISRGDEYLNGVADAVLLTSSGGMLAIPAVTDDAGPYDLLLGIVLTFIVGPY